MKRIPLRGKHGAGLFALVDDEDFERLMKFNWYCTPVRRKNASKRIYRKAVSKIGGVQKQHSILMHQEVIGGKNYDHRNRDTFDNQKMNLRPATQSQNNANVVRKNKSGFRGVCYRASRRKFVAQINFQSKNLVLGQFETIELAAHAYDDAAKKFYGEFAILNFPTELKK